MQNMYLNSHNQNENNQPQYMVELQTLFQNITVYHQEFSLIFSDYVSQNISLTTSLLQYNNFIIHTEKGYRLVNNWQDNFIHNLNKLTNPQSYNLPKCTSTILINNLIESIPPTLENINSLLATITRLNGLLLKIIMNKHLAEQKIIDNNNVEIPKEIQNISQNANQKYNQLQIEEQQLKYLHNHLNHIKEELDDLKINTASQHNTLFFHSNKRKIPPTNNEIKHPNARRRLQF